MHRTFVNFICPNGGRLSVVVCGGSLSSASLLRGGRGEACGWAEESAIRATIDSYVAAYNRGDAKAVAAHWSESGEWISPAGQRFQGKQAIEKEMQSLFKREQGGAHRGD